MNKQKIIKLSKIFKEIKNRNIEPLLKYNSGKIIHKKHFYHHPK